MVEINVLKRCNSPNIVGFFGAWLKGEELFVSVDGGMTRFFFLSGFVVEIRLLWSFARVVLSQIFSQFVKSHSKKTRFL